MFEELGKIEFMVVLIKPDKNQYVLTFDMDMSKKEIGKAIRDHVVRTEADVVVIIAEAWAILKPEESVTTAQLRKLAKKYGSVEQHPWSKDCLAIDFEYRDGTKEGWHWYIEKEGGKRVLKDGNLQWANGTKVVEVSGYLQDFF